MTCGYDHQKSKYEHVETSSPCNSFSLRFHFHCFFYISASKRFRLRFACFATGTFVARCNQWSYKSARRESSTCLNEQIINEKCFSTKRTVLLTIPTDCKTRNVSLVLKGISTLFINISFSIAMQRVTCFIIHFYKMVNNLNNLLNNIRTCFLSL